MTYKSTYILDEVGNTTVDCWKCQQRSLPFIQGSIQIIQGYDLRQINNQGDTLTHE